MGRTREGGLEHKRRRKCCCERLEMQPQKLLLRVYGRKREGQWTLMCLDFTLAVQAETLEKAQAKLSEQIIEYVNEATVGQDAQHAPYLLRRSAPLRYWLSYYLFSWLSKIRHATRSHLATERALPVVLAGA